MPFRLLGLATDPVEAGQICGRSFASYRAGGAHVTLVCAAAGAWDAEEARRAARAMGVDDLVLFEYQAGELTSRPARDALIDVLRAVLPHVVVCGAGEGPIKEAAVYAFTHARRLQRGTGALPAKLYYRSQAQASPALTTAVPVPGAAPELFVRAYPQPWVTGILERDLFAGLQASSRRDERLAA